jgi:IclR family transcriptional regulator, acetate operon repressor
VAHSQAAVEVSNVIEALALPKATAYRLVDGLVSSGYLAREPLRKRLTVGSRLTDLAFGAMRASMRDASRHALLRRLVHEVNETCNIGVMLHGEIVYLDRVEAEHWPLRLQFGPGSRVPLHCSAIGKLFLALTPSARRRRLVESLELRRFTATTITSRPRLEAELKHIRKERVSFDQQEYLVGVVCIAVPVLGGNGEPLAAIAIQAPEARMNLDAAREHLPALRCAAGELAETFQDNG